MMLMEILTLLNDVIVYNNFLILVFRTENEKDNTRNYELMNTRTLSTQAVSK